MDTFFRIHESKRWKDDSKSNNFCTWRKIKGLVCPTTIFMATSESLAIWLTHEHCKKRTKSLVCKLNIPGVSRIEVDGRCKDNETTLNLKKKTCYFQLSVVNPFWQSCSRWLVFLFHVDHLVTVHNSPLPVCCVLSSMWTLLKLGSVTGRRSMLVTSQQHGNKVSQVDSLVYNWIQMLSTVLDFFCIVVLGTWKVNETRRACGVHLKSTLNLRTFSLDHSPCDTDAKSRPVKAL